MLSPRSKCLLLAHFTTTGESPNHPSCLSHALDTSHPENPRHRSNATCSASPACPFQQFTADLAYWQKQSSLSAMPRPAIDLNLTKADPRCSPSHANSLFIYTSAIGNRGIFGA